jgi:hypothetical protein
MSRYTATARWALIAIVAACGVSLVNGQSTSVDPPRVFSYTAPQPSWSAAQFTTPQADANKHGFLAFPAIYVSASYNAAPPSLAGITTDPLMLNASGGVLWQRHDLSCAEVVPLPTAGAPDTSVGVCLNTTWCQPNDKACLELPLTSTVVVFSAMTGGTLYQSPVISGLVYPTVVGMSPNGQAFLAGWSPTALVRVNLPNADIAFSQPISNFCMMCFGAATSMLHDPTTHTLYSGVVQGAGIIANRVTDGSLVWSNDFGGNYTYQSSPCEIVATIQSAAIGEQPISSFPWVYATLLHPNSARVQLVRMNATNGAIVDTAFLPLQSYSQNIAVPPAHILIVAPTLARAASGDYVVWVSPCDQVSSPYLLQSSFLPVNASGPQLTEIGDSACIAQAGPMVILGCATNEATGYVANALTGAVLGQVPSQASQHESAHYNAISVLNVSTDNTLAVVAVGQAISLLRFPAGMWGTESFEVVWSDSQLAQADISHLKIIDQPLAGPTPFYLQPSITAPVVEFCDAAGDVFSVALDPTAFQATVAGQFSWVTIDESRGQSYMLWSSQIGDFVTATSLSTGETLWTQATPFPTTGALFINGNCVVSVYSGGVMCFDRTNGATAVFYAEDACGSSASPRAPVVGQDPTTWTIWFSLGTACLYRYRATDGVAYFNLNQTVSFSSPPVADGVHLVLDLGVSIMTFALEVAGSIPVLISAPTIPVEYGSIAVGNLFALTSTRLYVYQSLKSTPYGEAMMGNLFSFALQGVSENNAGNAVALFSLPLWAEGSIFADAQSSGNAVALFAYNGTIIIAGPGGVRVYDGSDVPQDMTGNRLLYREVQPVVAAAMDASRAWLLLAGFEKLSNFQLLNVVGDFANFTVTTTWRSDFTEQRSQVVLVASTQSALIVAASSSLNTARLYDGFSGSLMLKVGSPQAWYNFAATSSAIGFANPQSFPTIQQLIIPQSYNAGFAVTTLLGTSVRSNAGLVAQDSTSPGPLPADFQPFNASQHWMPPPAPGPPPPPPLPYAAPTTLSGVWATVSGTDFFAVVTATWDSTPIVVTHAATVGATAVDGASGVRIPDATLNQTFRGCIAFGSLSFGVFCARQDAIIGRLFDAAPPANGTLWTYAGPWANNVAPLSMTTDESTGLVCVLFAGNGATRCFTGRTGQVAVTITAFPNASKDPRLLPSTQKPHMAILGGSLVFVAYNIGILAAPLSGPLAGNVTYALPFSGQSSAATDFTAAFDRVSGRAMMLYGASGSDATWTLSVTTFINGVPAPSTTTHTLAQVPGTAWNAYIVTSLYADFILVTAGGAAYSVSTIVPQQSVPPVSSNWFYGATVLPGAAATLCGGSQGFLISTAGPTVCLAADGSSTVWMLMSGPSEEAPPPPPGPAPVPPPPTAPGCAPPGYPASTAFVFNAGKTAIAGGSLIDTNDGSVRTVVSMCVGLIQEIPAGGRLSVPLVLVVSPQSAAPTTTQAHLTAVPARLRYYQTRWVFGTMLPSVASGFTSAGFIAVTIPSGLVAVYDTRGKLNSTATLIVDSEAFDPYYGPQVWSAAAIVQGDVLIFATGTQLVFASLPSLQLLSPIVDLTTLCNALGPTSTGEGEYHLARPDSLIFWSGSCMYKAWANGTVVSALLADPIAVSLGPVYFEPTHAVCIGTIMGVVRCFHADTLTQMMRLQLLNAVPIDWLKVSGSLLYASTGGYVYAIDPASQKIGWYVNVGSYVSAAAISGPYMLLAPSLSAVMVYNISAGITAPAIVLSAINFNAARSLLLAADHGIVVSMGVTGLQANKLPGLPGSELWSVADYGPCYYGQLAAAGTFLAECEAGVLQFELATGNLLFAPIAGHNYMYFQFTMVNDTTLVSAGGGWNGAELIVSTLLPLASLSPTLPPVPVPPPPTGTLPPSATNPPLPYNPNPPAPPDPVLQEPNVLRQLLSQFLVSPFICYHPTLGPVAVGANEQQTRIEAYSLETGARLARFNITIVSDVYSVYSVTFSGDCGAAIVLYSNQDGDPQLGYAVNPISGQVLNNYTNGTSAETFGMTSIFKGLSGSSTAYSFVYFASQSTGYPDFINTFSLCGFPFSGSGETPFALELPVGFEPEELFMPPGSDFLVVVGVINGSTPYVGAVDFNSATQALWTIEQPYFLNTFSTVLVEATQRYVTASWGINDYFIAGVTSRSGPQILPSVKMHVPNQNANSNVLFQAVTQGVVTMVLYGNYGSHSCVFLYDAGLTKGLYGTMAGADGTQTPAYCLYEPDMQVNAVAIVQGLLVATQDLSFVTVVDITNPLRNSSTQIDGLNDFVSTNAFIGMADAGSGSPLLAASLPATTVIAMIAMSDYSHAALFNLSVAAPTGPPLGYVNVYGLNVAVAVGPWTHNNSAPHTIADLFVGYISTGADLVGSSSGSGMNYASYSCGAFSPVVATAVSADASQFYLLAANSVSVFAMPNFTNVANMAPLGDSTLQGVVFGISGGFLLASAGFYIGDSVLNGVAAATSFQVSGIPSGGAVLPYADNVLPFGNDCNYELKPTRLATAGVDPVTAPGVFWLLGGTNCLYTVIESNGPNAIVAANPVQSKARRTYLGTPSVTPTQLILAASDFSLTAVPRTTASTAGALPLLPTWTFVPPFTQAASTPIVVASGGSSAVVYATVEALYCIDAVSGSWVWARQPPQDILAGSTPGTPLAVGSVVISTFGAAVTAYELTGCATVSALATPSWSVTLNSTATTPMVIPPLDGTVLAAGTLVFVSVANGASIVAIDTETGAIQWTTQIARGSAVQIITVATDQTGAQWVMVGAQTSTYSLSYATGAFRESYPIIGSTLQQYLGLPHGIMRIGTTSATSIWGQDTTMLEFITADRTHLPPVPPAPSTPAPAGSNTGNGGAADGNGGSSSNKSFAIIGGVIGAALVCAIGAFVYRRVTRKNRDYADVVDDVSSPRARTAQESITDDSLTPYSRLSQKELRTPRTAQDV